MAAVRRLNHAVLYVRDAAATARQLRNLLNTDARIRGAVDLAGVVIA